MTSELKPCPFCGGDAEIINDCGQFYAECGNSACVSKPTTVLDDVLETVVEDWNTRAAPSADTLAGLVRYDVSSLWGRTISCVGEYALYSEAAAVVAAKDVEIEELKNILASTTSCKKMMTNQAAKNAERAKTAEAELDKLKAQEPVGYIIKHPRFTDDFQKTPLTEGDKHNGYTDHPVFLAAPVSDNLKVLNERLRETLHDIRKNAVGSMIPSSVIAALVDASLNMDTSPLAPEGGRE